MILFFQILVPLGLLGAILAVGLYSLPEKGRLAWYKTWIGRFIMADSCALAMIYSSGVINQFFRDWHFGPLLRVVFSISAVAVVWWRVGFIIRANFVRRKEKQNVD
jgi:hypothetical protein